MPLNILFLLPYPERKAPSQRFRIEAFFPLLDARGIQYKVWVFWSKDSSSTLYKKGKLGLKLFYLLQGFAKRFWQIFTGLKGVEYVVIHREGAPLGPPVFEWMIAKVFRKKIIYDFDDAIWIPNISSNNRLAISLKFFWKVRLVCKWSYKVSVGNHFLGKWAAQYNPFIVYNPTCVDMEQRYNSLKHQATESVTIGWTGSHSTLKYLDMVVPILEELEREYQFTFLVICDKAPTWTIKSLRFKVWEEKSEIADLLEMNIGIMPLEDDAWSEGKCGFKLIQYLALGIPAVASPVGVNKEIVEVGKNGFLCRDASEWKASLKLLLTDAPMRTAMGAEGHKKMKEQFSVASNAATFLSLFS